MCRELCEVAQLLIAARLSHEAILTAMELVVALNALVMGILQVSMGAGALPFVMSPVLFGALLAAMLVVSVMVLTGVGRMLGGTARAEDLAVLLAWLQAVRILWQVIEAEEFEQFLHTRYLGQKRFSVEGCTALWNHHSQQWKGDAESTTNKETNDVDANRILNSIIR